MKMIGSIRVNIVGINDPMLSIADIDNGVAIELFGEEISELRNWLNEQESAFLPSDAEFQPRFTPEEFEAIVGPFEDRELIDAPFEDVADEM